jgi:hypothetical protein
MDLLPYFPHFWLKDLSERLLSFGIFFAINHKLVLVIFDVGHVELPVLDPDVYVLLETGYGGNQ